MECNLVSVSRYVYVCKYIKSVQNITKVPYTKKCCSICACKSAVANPHQIWLNFATVNFRADYVNVKLWD